MKLDGTIEVGIADDHDLLRKGMAALLNDRTNLEVVIQAANGLEVIESLRNKSCDVILLDLNMPVLDGRETLDILQKSHPHIHIIVISVNCESYVISECFEKGVKCFLPKEIDVEILFEVLETVVNNGAIPKSIETKINALVHPNPNDYEYACLTEREREVIELVCKGKKNKEIAEELFISKRTVEGHRTSIAQKTATNNVAELVVFALKNKLYRLS